MELERILHSQGFGSRRQCQALIMRGAVAVGSTVCIDPHADFGVDQLAFSVDGEHWQYREKAYLALHKPAGFECSRTPQHHSSVFTLLPEPLRERGIQCVGRLDQDTTGLLLLSDDGQFVHAYTSPKRKVAKIYHATLKHAFDTDLLNTLLTGVLLHGENEPLKAIAARQLSEHLLELTIMEGKYHQVKRMVAAAGNRVEGLHRHAIGNFALPPTLAAGEWIWLDEMARRSVL